MPVFKDENKGTWYVMARYVDWTGTKAEMQKRLCNEARSPGMGANVPAEECGGYGHEL